MEDETYPYLRVFTTLVVEVAVDIKPGSCPNPLNLTSNGVLPVAILGSTDFDVNSIDPASVRLVDVAPVRHSFEDVATPVVDGNECDCADTGPDGYLDLILKFKARDIVAHLAVTPDDLAEHVVLELLLTGALTDGARIEGADCVRIVGKLPKSVRARRSDADRDGLVDMGDFAMMAEDWLEPTF
jgi:hypothetical protein